MSQRILYLGLDPTHYQAQGEIIHWPIIDIVPRSLSDSSLQLALGNFDHYSHVIITSKSTVGILKDYLLQLGFSLQHWAAKITVAVGQVTAKHLEACGIKPARIAQEETAEGMVRELQQLPLERAHLFWPHSSQARPILKEFFLTHHIRYTACALYDPQPRIPPDLPSLDLFDEIVFTSPSTVEAFLTIFGKFPSHLRLTPIGPVTAQYLQSRR